MTDSEPLFDFSYHDSLGADPDHGEDNDQDPDDRNYDIQANPKLEEADVDP